MRPLATQEVVFRAADELLAEGRMPSVRLLQERTGGSNRTVQQHLDAWKVKQRDDIANARKQIASARRIANLAAAAPLATAQLAQQKAEALLLEAEVKGQQQRRLIDTLAEWVRELEAKLADQHADIEAKAARIAQLEALLAQHAAGS